MWRAVLWRRPSALISGGDTAGTAPGRNIRARWIVGRGTGSRLRAVALAGLGIRRPRRATLRERRITRVKPGELHGNSLAGKAQAYVTPIGDEEISWWRWRKRSVWAV